MSDESVKSVLDANGNELRVGDVYEAVRYRNKSTGFRVIGVVKKVSEGHLEGYETTYSRFSCSFNTCGSHDPSELVKLAPVPSLPMAVGAVSAETFSDGSPIPSDKHAGGGGGVGAGMDDGVMEGDPWLGPMGETVRKVQGGGQ